MQKWTGHTEPQLYNILEKQKEVGKLGTSCTIFDLKKNKIKTMIVNLGYEEFGGYVGFIKIIVHFLEVGSVWLIIFNFSVNHFGAIQAIPSFVFFILDKENEELNAQ